MVDVAEGIDLSHHNGTVDWSLLKAAAPSCVYLKATEGFTYHDPKYLENYKAAKQAGIPVGAYHFYSFGKDPAQQAQNFIGQVALTSGDLIPVCDIENTGGQDDSQATAHLQTYLDTIEKHYGVKPMIYTAAGFWDATFPQGGFGGYPLWVANYGASSPHIPKGWSDWVLWQYTQSGSIDGVQGNVDRNKVASAEALQGIII